MSRCEQAEGWGWVARQVECISKDHIFFSFFPTFIVHLLKKKFGGDIVYLQCC